MNKMIREIKIANPIPVIFIALLFTGCTSRDKISQPDYYKNLYTQETLNKSEYDHFVRGLFDEHYDSVKGNPHIVVHFESLIDAGDSVIQPFKYDVRIGNEYKIRARAYEKIGMSIPPRTFRTVGGDSIQIGGKQTKPTLVNLWFIGCRGCVEEMPALNRLQEKYADKVNFVSITFDQEENVLKFLRKKEFNYKHITGTKETSTEDYLKYIGSYPYPENIFIDQNGTIRYIEGGLPHDEDLDSAIKHFESILDELLLSTKI